MSFKYFYFFSLLFFAIITPQNIVCAQNVNRAITIDRIDVEGSTVVTPKTIEALISPYLGKKLTFEQLKQLTGLITDLYTERGYTTSGAFFPQQDISKGIVKIQVVEGKLERIETEGLERLNKNYINALFKKVNLSPINTNELQKALERLRLDPLIEKVDARLGQGTSLGYSVLLLEIEEAPLIDSRIIVDNHNSPAIGEIQGRAFLSHKNLLGWRDRATFEYNFTEGFSNYELNYTIPLNYSGTAISFGYRDGDSRIVESPFEPLDIKAEADTLSLAFRQKIVRTATTESSVSLIFDRSTSETFILGRPFSFAEGPEEGLSKLSVFRLEADWLKRYGSSILLLKSQLSLGVDLFGATVNENDPDGRFLKWLGQVQWAKALDEERKIVLTTRLGVQLASDALLPFEKFSLGGVNTVRGYRRNFFLGDNGVFTNIEIAFLVVEDEDGWGKLKLIPFVDLGRVWNNKGNFGESLASVGLGLDWQPRDWISLSLNYAISLSDVENRGDSLSDSGISFSVRFTPF